MTIGKQIKKKRMELGISQRELAEKMGYSNHSTIARIEAGKVDISQSKIIQFADVLNTTTAYLMEWEREEKTVDNTTKGVVTIGDLFKYLRKQRKLSVSEFAEEIGLPETTIRGYELGDGGIPLKIVKMLSDYFGISSEKITSAKVESDDIFAAFASTNEAYVQQIKRWVEIFGNEKLSEEEFNKLIEYAKFLISQRNK